MCGTAKLKNNELQTCLLRQIGNCILCSQTGSSALQPAARLREGPTGTPITITISIHSLTHSFIHSPVERGRSIYRRVLSEASRSATNIYCFCFILHNYLLLVYILFLLRFFLSFFHPPPMPSQGFLCTIYLRRLDHVFFCVIGLLCPQSRLVCGWLF